MVFHSLAFQHRGKSCRVLLQWIRKFFLKILSKFLSCHKISRMLWTWIWLGLPMFYCAMQTPYLWYFQQQPFMGYGMLVLHFTHNINYKLWLNAYCCKFSVDIILRWVSHSWLLEHPRWCIKNSTSWMVWETNWEGWLVWLEGEPLFSSKCW